MLKSLLRTLLENAFIIFSVVMILLAFVYVVVYPTLSANGAGSQDDVMSLDGLIDDSTPSPTPSQVRATTIGVSGTLTITKTIVASPIPAVTRTPVLVAQTVVAIPSPTTKPANTPTAVATTATATALRPAGTASPMPSSRTATPTATRPSLPSATSSVVKTSTAGPPTVTATATPRR